MRQLTFNGYLEKYVRSLSSNNTSSIFKLAAETLTNHRLREPLFLYALSAGKITILLRATADNDLHLHYSVNIWYKPGGVVAVNSIIRCPV